MAQFSNTQSYRGQANEVQYLFRTNNYQESFNLCRQYLLDPDLPIYYRAGYHLLLARDTANDPVSHAEYAVRDYKELFENVPESYSVVIPLLEAFKVLEIIRPDPYRDCKQREAQLEFISTVQKLLMAYDGLLSEEKPVSVVLDKLLSVQTQLARHMTIEDIAKETIRRLHPDDMEEAERMIEFVFEAEKKHERKFSQESMNSESDMSEEFEEDEFEEEWTR